MGLDSDHFLYLHSSDLDDNFQIKIGSIDAKRPRASFEELINDPIIKYSGKNQESCSDMYVECQLFSNKLALTRPIRTSYKPFTTRWNWNEWISLPYRISDLPRNTSLALTVYDSLGPTRLEVVGGTSVSLFGKQGIFCQGLHDLKLWYEQKADPNVTPGEGSFHEAGKDKMQRLNQLKKKYTDGQITTVDWLDRLTFREIELINDQEKRVSNFMYLTIEFPKVEYNGVPYSIVHWEINGQMERIYSTSSQLVKLQDTETHLENLQETKHHRLVRSTRHGHKDDKPNAVIRDTLDKIMNYPPTKVLSSNEQDTVWQYKKYLSGKKKALTKFLKCVKWKLPEEAASALEMMGNWAPPSVDDSLELLGPTFTQPEVRSYAVERLSLATDEDLLLYLLQLVQALKYESWDGNNIKFVDSFHYSYGSNLSNDSTEESLQFESSENSLSKINEVINNRPSNIERSQSIQSSIIPNEDTESNLPLQDDNRPLDLATFLISRACNNSVLANYLYWYLLVECEGDGEEDSFKNSSKEMYSWVMRRFLAALQQNGKDSKHTRQFLTRQNEFLNKLVELVLMVQKDSSNRMRRTEKLQFLLSDPEAVLYNFQNLESLPLPLDPEVLVNGIVAEQATLFKSNLEPCRLVFAPDRSCTKNNYVTIFKHGDDLRQDQLILQIITLMDRLLRRENLDLKLTPYKVLATSSKNGFLQFIESSTVADVLKAEGSIQNYFKKHAPSNNSAYGFSPQVLDNYIKSCAGYCVITYLLGIGDRHLDNLLLTKEGNLFHIDFGYILGRDPKPMPPPMKLTKEMVEAMGGQNSEHYNDFRKLCYTAFQQLRRHANLILNLFSLMVDANVPDIALEPDKTVKKVEDKFRLDLDDEGAVSYMQGLIDDSVSAVVAAVVERFHTLAQYIRK